LWFSFIVLLWNHHASKVSISDCTSVFSPSQGKNLNEKTKGEGTSVHILLSFKKKLDMANPYKY
jgi:hypothetical protein